MALQIYNTGLDAFGDWETATFQWVLLTAGSFNADTDTVAAVIAAGAEVNVATVTSYARVAASTKVRTVDDTGDQVTYTCADPDFGTLEAGETVTAALLIRVVTDDTDSIPVGRATITSTATDGIDPFTLAITSSIVAYVDQAA